MKTGIYGGTFNPPHIGHVKAAATAIASLGLDRLIVLPTGEPPHKQIPEGSPSGEQRLEMVKLAFSGLDRVLVSDLELRRGGPSYTCDTIRALREEYPEDELFLIMGTDMFATLDRWYNAGYILDEVCPAVLAREEDDMPELLEKAESFRQELREETVIIRSEVIEASSTAVREKVKTRGGRELVPPAVYAYIIRSRLYGARPDFDWLRTQAYAWLKPKRTAHVAGCEAEAVNLARRWGEDADDAREAAILHDITKKYELAEQLILCGKYGIITDNVEKREFKLLHAKTGAAVAESEFGVSERVRDAIQWHTTGKADMSLLEKIIYLADYIEPTRDFDGLTELRRLAYEDIDGALRLGLEMSVEDMKQRGITPHCRTQEAIDYLRQNG